MMRTPRVAVAFAQRGVISPTDHRGVISPTDLRGGLGLFGDPIWLWGPVIAIVSAGAVYGASYLLLPELHAAARRGDARRRLAKKRRR